MIQGVTPEALGRQVHRFCDFTNSGSGLNSVKYLLLEMIHESSLENSLKEIARSHIKCLVFQTQAAKKKYDSILHIPGFAGSDVLRIGVSDGLAERVFDDDVARLMERNKISSYELKHLDIAQTLERCSVLQLKKQCFDRYFKRALSPAIPPSLSIRFREDSSALMDTVKDI